ncbi:bifunctional type I 3-dehydroquinate dehydratase/shikimate dehydrogenase [Rubinisphaera margarita]|uniref:bifunctional type I 3-dehydroquinate dehydratase/shikimate dehydrogenase n=1 Tax=Rubinisphaera margarita TaxID=2909586 RepID=UPI001EE7F401|nr:type I 3-dehydroquinate dehydratase [Rubinisphaera margarita]MCG6157974.1 type I 3-dehydroquinate dehydratase [Rubinisphaera margarita]
MLCISVTPTSRTLARVDLLNASRQGDIIELCLDHLAKEPDFKELLDGVSKPVIISCKRKQDGGQWQGTEEERLTLLRQAIVAGPDYIELDLDIAPKVPRFGNTQRVISVTRLDRPEYDIDALFEEAVMHKADVIKFRWPTRTLDDAWPLLAAVSQRRGLPIVGQGIGRPELTFSLLAQKYESPWIYAALEKGMEDHPGQATVEELREIYSVNEIDRQTKFIAVAGFGELEEETVRVLNAGFRAVSLNMRCLPVEIDRLDRLGKMFDILKVRVLLANSELGTRLRSFIDVANEADAATGFFDVLLKQADGWHGFNTLRRSTLRRLEPKLREAFPHETMLNRRSALVIGNGGLGRTAVSILKERQAVIGLSGPDEKQAQAEAAELGIRHVPFQSLYDTHHDIVVLADSALQKGSGRMQFNPSYLRPDLFVIDFASLGSEHPLGAEARERGCYVVDGRQIWTDLLAARFKAITGENLSVHADNS